MLSRCFLDFSVSVWAFVIWLSQISSFFATFKSLKVKRWFENVWLQLRLGRDDLNNLERMSGGNPFFNPVCATGFWLLFMLQCFLTWVSDKTCVYQQANSDGRKIVAHNGIEPATSINQSPYTLEHPTELFRLMRITGFSLYLYIVAVFSSIRGCVIHITISIKQKILALMLKIRKIYVHIYLHMPMHIIYNKLWYLCETTCLHIEINVANVLNIS